MNRSEAAKRPGGARTTVLVLTPLGISLVAAIIAALAVPGFIRVEFAPAAALIGLGLIFTAVLAVLLVLRPRARYLREQEFQRGRLVGEQEVRAANRRLLARLDHELKNPVTAIRTALAAEPGAESSPNLRIAAGQAERLAQLIGGLRSLSALETQPIEQERVDLAAIVREEASALSEELAAHGARRRITVSLPTAPWPLPPVAGDPDLLAVAVRNLLVNAAKYSGEEAQIELRGREDEGSVVIEVADTGRGIAATDLDQVWDELWRGDEVRRIEGSGLGLSLVRVVVERHGGEVSIQSQPGRGTSVRLRIPVAGPPAG